MKLVLVFLLLASTVFAQVRVMTTKNYSENTIFNTKLDTVEYSTAVSMKGKEGITSLAFDADTTALTGGAARSDSCITVGFQIYVDGVGWSTYYDNRATFKGINYTKIDTIDRALVAGQNLVMNFATESDEDAVGDSLRFVFFCGVQDSVNLRVELRQE